MTVVPQNQTPIDDRRIEFTWKPKKEKEKGQGKKGASAPLSHRNRNKQVWGVRHKVLKGGGS